MRQLSRVIISAINATHDRHNFVPHVLRDLVKLESRPLCLSEMAYEWCSVICENQSFEDRESLLLDSLEIGFRHLDPLRRRIGDLHLIHTEHHRGLVDVVFKSNNNEVIADLLHAWTVASNHHKSAHTLLGICTGHLVDLHNLVPFSPRLRRLLIRSVEVIGYNGFEEVGVERFVELLNHLHVGVEEVEYRFKWVSLLLGTIQSPGGVDLSNHTWELLVELTTSGPLLAIHLVYNPHVMTSLLEAQEWDKVECWIGVVLTTWSETDVTTEDFKRAMASLFRHRPGAAQKLTQWMKRWSRKRGVPEYFERIYNQAHEAAQQGIP